VAERNYYEVLGVSKMASVDDVQAHYLQKMHEVHPDRNPGDEDRATDRTIELVNAYRTLSDPVARKFYDFKMLNPMLLEGETAGVKLLKSKEKKEAELRFAEGVRYLQMDDQPKAVEAFKAALKLEPSFSAASYNLALLGAHLGNANFSLDILAKAIRSDPKDASLPKLMRAITATFMQV
jgi:tetratricopeptide (TPR) repeat protein